ncbi:unnamed protein product [Clonostachys solani]|uniref:ER membrane protein complex subunit 7 beta-sandwich domain-containing protein n=1 Tax=Clonostachys solani TaxID=160281 RepID=A0A9P0ERA6_9HYPO|nr:unnamed protein product [Clonostachys solani]
MRLEAACLLAFIASALAADLTLYLPSKPNPWSLPPSTRATLDSLGEHYAAPISSLNTFVFKNVSAPGSYLVDIHCATDTFKPLRVDIAADGKVDAWETFRGNDWANRGEAIPVQDGGAVEARFLIKKNYFQERPKFSVLTILKNPMILMGLVSMGIFIGMPKIMENMDPEMKAEFEARQAEGPLSALMGGGASRDQGSFDMAGYLAGSNKEDGNGGKKSQGVRR